jgi:hypothetical protein
VTLRGGEGAGNAAARRVERSEGLDDAEHSSILSLGDGRLLASLEVEKSYNLIAMAALSPVLYEMPARKRAFPFDDVTETLAAVITKRTRLERTTERPATGRREYVGFVTEAKKPETRARRIEQTIAALVKRRRATSSRTR